MECRPTARRERGVFGLPSGFIAFYLLADRKIWAAVQLRRGPNVVGPFGLMQSFADLLKFVLKEPVIPAGANKGVSAGSARHLRSGAPAWAVLPFEAGVMIANINVGILYFSRSPRSASMAHHGGWASNSKYPFLVGLRSAAQMVSYESPSALSSSPFCSAFGSLNLT